MTAHLLSLVLFLPLAGMLGLLLLPPSVRVLRGFAALVAAVTFGFSLLLLPGFQTGSPGFQYVERASWIPAIGAQYLIGLDGISLLLVLLTTLVSLLAIGASWNSISERPRLFYAMILLLESGLIGVFTSLDLFLFYLFWDTVLIPMYFIIGIYGGERRSYAAIKFFLYTLLGSVFLLLGFLAIYFQYGQATGVYTFELTKLMSANLPLHVQQWIFWGLFLGFAVKVPMFPLHTWLPDAHVEAPTAGSVLLASLMLKMGTYGFIRFSLPLVPAACSTPAIVTTMAVLSLIAIIYGALVCLMQRDWKKLVAYSSISHLGFCTLGIFALNYNGITGSVIQQVSHGISTGLLFLLVGFIYERRHTREIADYGGLAQVMPVFATVFAITVFSSAGLPLLNGFIGEFTILSGAFAVNRVWATVGVIGIVLSASYLLWLYQRTMMGPVKYDVNRHLPDLTARERLIVLPLVVLAFAIGIYPAPLFRILQPAVHALVGQAQAGAFHP
ncbi:MAG: proton-translocating NADH-quinone oxidoreductase, chain [Bryobacterales bacterium]|nr:proton-translocating NADH-quinone oxidoreductase, chain [Bryobacterales bacterium]